MPQPETTPNFDFSIEAPHRSAVPRAVDEIHFKLVDIVVEGTTVIPAERFTPLFAGLRGKTITLATIFDVADSIEREYRTAGYPLVRAYVPPQRVKNGIFTVKVVEGFVSSVFVQGGRSSVQDLVKAYFEPVRADHPLRLATIERALLLANAIPGVSATGVLRPSPSVRAASDLVVIINQPRVTGLFFANNRGSHYTGIWSATGSVAYNGILGGDELDASVTASPDKLDEQLAGRLRYRTAIGDSGLVGTVFGAVTRGVPGGALEVAKIHSDSWAFGPRLTYPLISSRADSLTLDGGFTVQNETLSVLGTRITHDAWRVLDVSLAYSTNTLLPGKFDASADLAQGLPGLGSTPNHSQEASLDGRTTFTKITTSFHYLDALPAAFSYAVSGSAQYSLEPLITGEQAIFGGTQIGRGYDPGAITGDSGAGLSLELRRDMRFADLPIENFQPYAFFDAAKVWNKARPAIDGIPLANFAIASTGLGIRVWFPYNVYVDVEGSRTLTPVPGSDSGKRATKLLVDLSVAF